MTMILDRDFQRALLKELAPSYPKATLSQVYLNHPNRELAAANTYYLFEHGLIGGGVALTMSGSIIVDAIGITKEGLDFLSDDGGLTAILNTVTVRIHTESIQQLLAAKIDASDAPEAEKSRIKGQIKKLPNAVLSEVTKQLVSRGVESLPNAFEWLQTQLSGPTPL
jgi:hypothetical protein